MGLLALDETDLTLSDHDLCIKFWSRWIAFQASRKGIPISAITPGIAENIRLASINLDTDSIQLTPLEKILRLSAIGDTDRAGRMLRDLILSESYVLAAQDEATTGRRRQKQIASKRRPDALQELIISLVQKTPSISVKNLLKALKSMDGELSDAEVIEEITDDEIYFIENGKGGNIAPISGLKDRLTRAKKIIKSR
jgi:hypothetical protein